MPAPASPPESSRESCSRGAVGRIRQEVSLPGALPLLGAAAIPVAAAIVAVADPAARASRVDVMQALRCE